MVLMNTHTHTHTIHHHHHHHRKPELTLGCLLILRFCWHYIDRTSLVANYGRETQDGDAVICYVSHLLFARFVICMFMTAKSWRYGNGAMATSKLYLFLGALFCGIRVGWHSADWLGWVRCRIDLVDIVSNFRSSQRLIYRACSMWRYALLAK